jgi:hypothetical protein
MRVITSNPILYKDSFSNVDDLPAGMYNPNANINPIIMTTASAPPTVAPKETLTTQSLGTPITTKKESVFNWKNSLSDIVNAFTKPKAQPKKTKSTYQPSQLPPPPPTGLSTTTKILIGVGSAAVLGTIIYLIVRKK